MVGPGDAASANSLVSPTTPTIVMRAVNSPGCGFMHRMPTSAVSSAARTGSGAARKGRPKSSSNSPV